MLLSRIEESSPLTGASNFGGRVEAALPVRVWFAGEASRLMSASDFREEGIRVARLMRVWFAGEDSRLMGASDFMGGVEAALLVRSWSAGEDSRLTVASGLIGGIVEVARLVGD